MGVEVLDDYSYRTVSNVTHASADSVRSVGVSLRKVSQDHTVNVHTCVSQKLSIGLNDAVCRINFKQVFDKESRNIILKDVPHN